MTWIRLHIILTALFLGSSCTVSSQAIITIRTKLGDIRGKAVYFNESTIYAFLGIPFAKPPVGPLRFRKPKPAERFEQPYDAFYPGPGCPQIPPSNNMGMHGFPGYKEDCLYMNIWVPKPVNRRRKVMFWIYGGSFYKGANGLVIYDDKAISSTGDVIVVSINYRLGMLGWLYSGTGDAPGNMGLSDVLLGLKWVKQNIESFGGDPYSVTVFGESAGSAIIGTLSVSPLARGLYKRAIMESGSPMISVLYDDGSINMERGGWIAEQVKCANSTFSLKRHPKEVVSCLRGISTERIVQEDIYGQPLLMPFFRPQYGDKVVPVEPVEAINNGDFKYNELLIGINSDEIALALEPHHDIMHEQLLSPRLPKYYPFPRHLTRSNTACGHISAKCGFICRLSKFFTDVAFACPSAYYATAYAGKSNDVYFCFYTHRPCNSSAPPWARAVHADEVPYVHGLPARQPQNFTREEVRLSLRMMKLWTNFAKTGDPGEDWPLYSEGEPIMRVLDTTQKHIDQKGPDIAVCKALRIPYLISDATDTIAGVTGIDPKRIILGALL